MAASTASVPGHPLSTYMRGRADAFRSRMTAAVAADLARRAGPAEVDPEVAAEHLVLLFDGLQVEWMLHPGMDVLAAFDRAVGALRVAHLHADEMAGAVDDLVAS
jgi:hypothetical protein